MAFTRIDMARLKDPYDTLNNEDKELFDSMEQKRGRIDGMYRTLFHHPQLIRRIGPLGEFLRFHGTLPGDLREFIILYISRKFTSAYEWTHHEKIAKKEGLKEEIIEKIFAKKPITESPFKEVIQLCEHVFKQESIPPSLQEELIGKFSTQGLIEMVILFGFYQMISQVIASFDVPQPPDMPSPFKK